MRNIIQDFLVQGYSLIDLKPEVYQNCIEACRLFYSLSPTDQLSCLSSADSGILGYKPSLADFLKLELQTDNSEANYTSIYSSFDFLLEDCEYLGKYELFKQNQWPKDENLKTIALQQSKILKIVSRGICQEILRNEVFTQNELSGTLLQKSISGNCLNISRLLKYPKSIKLKYSKEHTDYEFITIIISNNEGLQVKQNRTWETVPFVPGTAVVLPGDMIEAATNGFIKSSLHRVYYTRSPRYSYIFFQGLPLDFPIEYEALGAGTYNFGKHIMTFLLSSAKHLENNRLEIMNEIGITEIPTGNPFKKWE